MQERVVVAMSGGVDSSVAAVLLKEQGYEVIGITMCFNLSDVESKKPRCCGLEGIEDARRVAHKLGVRHYVLNLQKVLKEKVIRDFCLEYSAGRTPNPCIRCNQFVKFGALLTKARSLGAKYLATGHYARTEYRAQSTEHRKRFLLKKAKDKTKDQTYFLYRLGQEQLRHVLFPLGDYTKEQVRKLAHQYQLPVADKPGSQEICFLPQDDYRKFLKSYLKIKPKLGPIVDSESKVLGEHQGIAFYTIGQREGLGVAAGYPVYITKIDRSKNTIIVGRREDALSREFFLKAPHFLGKLPKNKVEAAVKIRYNHKEAAATIIPAKNKLKIRFKHPQFAVTPGQSAVFYQKETVIGGGIIDEVLN